jgi:pimeloyl-ACP methyl ester carboxylesterase
MPKSSIVNGAGCLALLAMLGWPLGPGLLAQGAVSIGGQPESDATLRRRAVWHGMIAPLGGDSGALVHRIESSSPAARAGLQAGDRLVALNGTPVLQSDAFWPAFRRLRGGDTVRARVLRGKAGATRADTFDIRFVLDSAAHEQIPGTVTTYGAIRSERGYLLRTIVSRPEHAAAGRLPAVLFIPWLSCDPVEKPDPGNDGFAHMLRAVAAGAGMVMMRVEKPGLGDSQGPDCSVGGLDDEMAAPRAGLRALRAMPGVDPSRIFVMGGSIGGGLAPILAAAEPQGIAGVIAVSGFTRTWYEHMLEIERRRLTLSGSSPAEVNSAMRGFAQFYTDYLMGGRTPEQVLAARPELRPLWYDEPTRQYGRPAAYYQAVQRLDVEAAWGALAERGIPALVVWGEYDWIMGRAEAERAVEIVNARKPGLAQLIVLAKTDHSLMTYASLAAAFADEGPRNDGAAGRAITAWLRERSVHADRSAAPGSRGR